VETPKTTPTTVPPVGTYVRVCGVSPHWPVRPRRCRTKLCARASCPRSLMCNRCGSITMRSLPPLPEQTTNAWFAKFRSLTRSCKASETRRPMPYSSCANRGCLLTSYASTVATSSGENTTGMRRVIRCRAMSFIQGRLTHNTLLYGKSSADKA
jgi:hypothetical protein